ncbi:MAG: hypothetical protein H6648_03515 [Caldilineae bacterium]|nr:hypothetical protein [Chloroflexota bacterium]MCB9176203.1 hypothetical protein [Caldilineae bacterium]
MASNDRFLVAIVAGVSLLVVVAFAVARLQPEPSFRPDGDPESAAHNYLLALERQDWPRAYGYLSPSLVCYPATAAQFVDDLSEDNRWLREFEGVELRVVDSSVQGDVALVTVRETRYWSGGLFDSGQSSNDFEMKLIRESGIWHLTRSDQYWWWGWSDAVEGRCREGRVPLPEPASPEGR